MNRFKIIAAASFTDLVQQLNALGRESLFSRVVYFGPADTTGFIAVLDFSYQPVITYEDIVSRSQPTNETENDIEADIDEFEDENTITLSA
jgi:hypothetical protein